MSGLRRFFSDKPIHGDHVVITGPEAHHILHVVRLRAGEECRLFDGSGNEYGVRLRTSSRNRAEFEVLSRDKIDREPGRHVTIASAVPKGRRAEILVEKCCEIGAAAWIPMACARSVVDPRIRAENHLAKWRRTVIEASKQCGRNVLMQVSEPQSFMDTLGQPGDFEHCWICRGGASVIDGRSAARGTHLVVVGPEGGFEKDEVLRAESLGFSPLCLGQTTLRVETACFVALAVLLNSGGVSSIPGSRT